MPPQPGRVGVMACRSTELRVLAEVARSGALMVVIDQAEDLRRRLLEQETLVRAEADVDGVPPARVEAALTSSRAAAHVLGTISTAVEIELEQQRWVAGQVARFAGRLIDAAQHQLQAPAASRGAAIAGPRLRVARSTPAGS